MKTLLVMGSRRDGHLQIISAHVSYSLALQSAMEVMAEPRATRLDYPWMTNPAHLLPVDFPGNVIQAWMRGNHPLANHELSSLKIVELYVEGTVLDALAE